MFENNPSVNCKCQTHTDVSLGYSGFLFVPQPDVEEVTTEKMGYNQRKRVKKAKLKYIYKKSMQKDD